MPPTRPTTTPPRPTRSQIFPSHSFLKNGRKVTTPETWWKERRPEIVAGAWDFERINRRYARHLKVLAERPAGALRNDAAAKALLRWAAAESRACGMAGRGDPAPAGLLPGRILPSDYPGQPAWRRRVEVLRDAGRQLRTFNPEKTGAGRA